MKSLAILVIFLLHMATVTAQGTIDKIVDLETTEPSSIIDEDDTLKLAPFLIRLHLIRHGETEANVQNIVLGQGDSPLTDNGVALARLAAGSEIINGKRLKYWRAYCSDLHRAHRTARIVLGLEDGDGNIINHEVSSGVNLVVDSRLRELAKGAREEYPKNLSYEEALAMRRAAAAANGEIKVPKLESIDEAWDRAKDWIDSLIHVASEDYYSDNRECEVGDTPKIYDIFALSHSALIRTMIHKMVNDELPPNHATTREGSLSIPNLSRTIIDVRPFNKSSQSSASKLRWTPSLFRLTDTSHLIEVKVKTIPGPPYL